MTPPRAGRSFDANVERDLAARVDALLPQTQCTRCGYPDCRRYAEAIAAADADINRCPPGGDDTLAALAALTGSTATALAADLEPTPTPLRVALIDEQTCIGCTKCIQACPLDAIVGAGKLMHTVLAAECSGCELCLPPCPVDCITLPAAGLTTWSAPRAERARQRYQRRELRLARVEQRRRERQNATAEQDLRRPQQLDADAKRAAIADAVARARKKRAALNAGNGGTPS